MCSRDCILHRKKANYVLGNYCPSCSYIAMKYLFFLSNLHRNEKPAPMFRGPGWLNELGSWIT